MMLYGYAPGAEWSAIHFYELHSNGLICEDYDRQPPPEQQRYNTTLASSSHTHPRALTKEERVLARQYHGGDSWIKVTFDSREAADRAIEISPHRIQGHWVYAQLFNGQGPQVDAPIPVREADMQQGLLGVPRPTSRPQTIGPAFSRHPLDLNLAPRGTATLPRSFGTNSDYPATNQRDHEHDSLSSNTVSSGTALEDPQIRHRNVSRPGGNQSSALVNAAGQPREGQRYFTHFPNIPRTELRPASEAFLPQPSWWERQLRWLAEHGWIPGEVIGNAVPRLENGDFDWASASFYWKICYWFDSHLGTDLCGMREE